MGKRTWQKLTSEEVGKWAVLADHLFEMAVGEEEGDPLGVDAEAAAPQALSRFNPF